MNPSIKFSRWGNVDMETPETILSDFKTKKQQVEFLLDKYPATRDNDFYLQYMWLKIFGNLKLPYIDWNDIRMISGTLETVSRVRRKIQNEEGRYLPSDGVRADRERKRKIITENIGRF
jgi:hypothetical protein